VVIAANYLCFLWSVPVGLGKAERRQETRYAILLAMPRAVDWIVLAIVAAVLLSPLGEFFDKTDQWSQDGSDFVFYIICVFCFLGWSMRRVRVIIARLASPQIRSLTPCQRPLLERMQSRSLFLSFCDLRI